MCPVLKKRGSESGVFCLFFFVEEEVGMDQEGGGRMWSEVSHLQATQGGSES